MRKLNLEFVQTFFKENECELLEDKYINSKTKMKYKCSCGNISSISFYAFKSGQRCKECGYKNRKIPRRYSYTYIKQFFEDNNCKLLESEYINSKTKMKYICECGNKSEIRFNDFQQGHRCYKCSLEKYSGENSPHWISNREQIEDLQLLHMRSAPYKRKFRKKNNIIDSNLHVDHIFPIKAFVEHGIKDMNVINHESNFQILTAEENRKKRDKYDKSEFKSYLKRIL